MQRRREARCRQEPQIHSRRATTPSPEGPRYVRGKIACVKHAAVWPAYLVAAVCVAIALISSIANISLLGQLKQQQREVASLTERSTSLARSLSGERTALFDMLDSTRTTMPSATAKSITRGSRIDLALHELSEPPRGQVYQVWTRPVGSTKMSPAPTFLRTLEALRSSSCRPTLMQPQRSRSRSSPRAQQRADDQAVDQRCVRFPITPCTSNQSRRRRYAPRSIILPARRISTSSSATFSCTIPHRRWARTSLRSPANVGLRGSPITAANSSIAAEPDRRRAACRISAATVGHQHDRGTSRNRARVLEDRRAPDGTAAPRARPPARHDGRLSRLCRSGPLVEVRHAEMDEWRAVAESSASMIRQELEYDPRRNSANFNMTIREMDRAKTLVGWKSPAAGSASLQHRSLVGTDRATPRDLDSLGAARPRPCHGFAGRNLRPSARNNADALALRQRLQRCRNRPLSPRRLRARRRLPDDSSSR